MEQTQRLVWGKPLDVGWRSCSRDAVRDAERQNHIVVALDLRGELRPRRRGARAAAGIARYVYIFETAALAKW